MLFRLFELCQNYSLKSRRVQLTNTRCTAIVISYQSFNAMTLNRRRKEVKKKKKRKRQDAKLCHHDSNPNPGSLTTAMINGNHNHPDHLKTAIQVSASRHTSFKLGCVLFNVVPW